MFKALTTRRSRILAMGAILIAVLLICPFALAQDNGLRFTLSVDPAKMTAPGKTTVSIRVSNTGANDISDPISLYDPQDKLVTSFFDGGQLFPLKAGDFRTWQGPYEVTQEELDSGKLTFTLRYNSTDESGNVVAASLPASADLQYAGEKVDLKVTRTIHPPVIRPKSDVSVIYELVNQGNVALKNIIIKENNTISTKTETLNSLAAGEKKTITFTRTAGNVGLTSSALITYKKDGDKKTYKQTLAAQAIPLAKPNLVFTLTSDKTQLNIGEKAVLTLTLNNGGNISYTNVTVTDAKLGEVFSAFDIPAGQTIVKTKEITVNETLICKFTLNLSDNTGVSKKEIVPELKLSAYTEGQMLRLSLQLSADREAVSSLPGDIKMTLLITNDSNTTAKNIKIKHGDTTVSTIAQLTPGQSSTLTRDFSISQAGKFRFSAEGVDVQKNIVSFDSNELYIGYTEPTPNATLRVMETIPPAVTHSPLPADYTTSNSALPQVLLVLLWVFGVLFGVALLLVIAGSVVRLKATAKSKMAYDHVQLGSSARDYTKPARESEEMESPASEEDSQDAPAVKEALPHEKYLEKKDEAASDEETAQAPEKAEGGDELSENAVFDVPKAPRVTNAKPQVPAKDGAYTMTREEATENPEVPFKKPSRPKKNEPKE